MRRKGQSRFSYFTRNYEATVSFYRDGRRARRGHVPMNPLDVVIRPAEPDDAEKIHDLHTASVRGLCSGHYSAEVIDGWLMGRSPAGYLGAIQRGVLFVAQRDERVLGFGHFGTGKVVAIFVDPTAERCGVGRLLLHHAM